MIRLYGNAVARLCVAAVAACVAVAGHADPSRAIRADYPVTRLSDRVYVIHGPVGAPTKENQGFNSNVTFVVTKAGVVVVDPGTSRYVGEMVLKKIRSVTDRPVVAVFNSHIHGDHWLGNQAFRDANPDVRIYAHPNMKKLADAGAGDASIRRLNKATGDAIVGTRAIAPDRAVADGEVIAVGELSFKAHHAGPAHTDGDIMVEIVEEQVLLTGDIVRAGLVGISNASFKGNIAAMDRALMTGCKRFVPGHGRSGDATVVKDYRRFMRILRQTVAKHYDAGLGDFEIKPKVVESLAEFKDWALFDENLGRLVSLAYLEVEADAF